VRNENAYGVNLKWEGKDKLALEYLETRSAELLREEAVIKGEQVHVLLRVGINDTSAPAGGMLYNLEKKN
jgi:hypothetical protein